MSRIGKKPIEIPSGVEATLKDGTIEVKGALGMRFFDFSEKLNVDIVDKSISVTPKNLEKETRQLWGMSRSQIANIVHGVNTGFSKELEINGVGYRAAVQGKVLKLSLGYSHDVDFDIPDDVKITCVKPTEIKVEGIDQQVVGEVASKIRAWRSPEPYKGKGIRYKGEYIFAKEGKKK